MGLENYIKQDDPDSENYQPCLLVYMIMATLVYCVLVCMCVFINVVKSERT